jgi:hypothetical protein
MQPIEEKGFILNAAGFEILVSSDSQDVPNEDVSLIEATPNIAA